MAALVYRGNSNFDLGKETEITKSVDKKLNRLLEAKKNKEKITIYYQKAKGKLHKRQLTPEKMKGIGSLQKIYEK